MLPFERCRILAWRVAEGNGGAHVIAACAVGAYDEVVSELEHVDVFKDPLTPVVFLERTLRVFPDRTAVIDDDLRWSYADFAREVGLMAGALRRFGIVSGDRVAILAPNTPWHLVAHFAMPRTPPSTTP